MQLSNSLVPRSSASSGYLLRQHGGAAAAYSLQRLDTSTENVIRARESVGDTEADFTAEEVSGGALREFALQNDADLIRFANQATAADKRIYFDGGNEYVSGLNIGTAGRIKMKFVQCAAVQQFDSLAGHRNNPNTDELMLSYRDAAGKRITLQLNGSTGPSTCPACAGRRGAYRPSCRRRWPEAAHGRCRTGPGTGRARHTGRAG